MGDRLLAALDHARAKWPLLVWVGLTAVLAVGASHFFITRTVDNFLRMEAENAARSWAQSVVRVAPDIEDVVEGRARPSRGDEIIESVLTPHDVFLFKLFDSKGQLALSSDKSILHRPDAGVFAHNPEAARVAFEGRTYTVFQENAGKPGRPRYYSEAYMPIVRDGRTAAVVEIYVNQTDRYNAHHAESRALTLVVALIVAIAFGIPAMLALYRSRQIERAHADLRLHSLRFEGAIDSMSHGLSVFDAMGKLVTCNKRFRNMYKLPPHLATPGTSIGDLYAYAERSGQLPAFHPGLDTSAAAVGHTSEQVLDLLDGRVVAVSITGLADGGRVSIHKDVTEERRTAARVVESEARFRDFTRAASDWCWETDAEHRFSYITDGFQAATGVDPARVLGMKRHEAPVHADDRAAIAAHEEVLAARKPFRDFVVHIKKPDGTYGSIKSSGTPRWDADGTFLGYRGTARDITALEANQQQLSAAQEALLLRSRQLVEAQRLGRIGDWAYTLGQPYLEWGPELYELLRYDRTDGPILHATVMSNYVGDSARRVLACQKQVSSTGIVRSVDVKFRRGDGVVVDVVVTSKPLYGPDGKIAGFSGTIQDITERKLAEEQLEKLAFYDPLTGLANRALFTRELDAVLEDAVLSGRAAALLLLDLDHFKEVNDSLGHSSGDELLVKAGHIISRRLDATHFIARLGGDEFAIIARTVPDHKTIELLARDVIEAVSGSIVLTRGEVIIGTSIGIAYVEGGATTSSELLRNADLALYRAKEEGRGRFATFSPEMDNAVQHKLILARELRRAVAEGTGLSVHYQPQVDLRSGLVTGYEALMRWTHPTMGPISPSEFIPLAESSHLIIDLGLWILRHAAVQAKAWHDMGAPARRISVNISAAQIWHSDLASDVKRILSETGLPPQLLCLELTESLLVDHAEGRVRSVLRALKELGVILALDDFGTDYSSLGYLTQLPFDKLKIDRVFVGGIATSARPRELLKGIIALGHGLGMAVVAEGAETTEEIAALTELGCDLVQGYAVARPMPAADVPAFTQAFETPRDDNPVHALHTRLRAEVA